MNALISPDQTIVIGLIFTRVIGIFLSFPLLNTSMIPTNIRVLLVISFSFYISMIFDLQLPALEWTILLMLLYIAKELLIGFMLGLLVNMFIAAFSYAAEIISYFMGLTIANVFDPTFGQVSVLNRFFVFTFYLIFFITGSYQYVIGGVVMSFEYLPISGFVLNEGVFQFLIEKSSLIFILGLQIAFPFALILFVMNVALALVNRLIPQVNVFIVGMPMQIFIGLASLAFGSATLVYLAVSSLERLGDNYLGVIQAIGT